MSLLQRNPTSNTSLMYVYTRSEWMYMKQLGHTSIYRREEKKVPNHKNSPLG